MAQCIITRPGGGILKLKNVFLGDRAFNGEVTISSIANAKIMFVQTKDKLSGDVHIQCMPLLPKNNGSFISSTNEQYIVNNVIRIHFPSATKLYVDDINEGHIYRIDILE